MLTTSAHRGPTGWIEVIVGSMFSGKTEELIRRVRRAQIARQRIQIFKPKIDNRYSETEVISHSAQRIESQVVESANEIFDHLDDTTRVVAIDEGQFFDEEVVSVAQKLANRGVRVLVAGLDTDWEGNPFGPMPDLMAVAEYVIKQHAICVRCGSTASRTQRTISKNEEILVGANDIYEARCRDCFDPYLNLENSRGPEPMTI